MENKYKTNQKSPKKEEIIQSEVRKTKKRQTKRRGHVTVRYPTRTWLELLKKRERIYMEGDGS